MKGLVVLTMLVLVTVSVKAQSQAEEHQRIAVTLNYYLEGGTNNDFSILKKAFHPTATMKFIRDGAYQEVNALEFFEKGMKLGPKQNRTTRIVSMDVSGTTAHAKLEIEYPTFILTDYMNLLLVDNEWKIVGKIFSRREK